MFPNLVDLIARRPHPSRERDPFIEQVDVHHPEPRSARVERLILACWILIAVKHVVVILLVRRYHMPFHQLWVNLPTWIIGAVATALYYWRVRQPRNRK